MCPVCQRLGRPGVVPLSEHGAQVACFGRSARRTDTTPNRSHAMVENQVGPRAARRDTPLGPVSTPHILSDPRACHRSDHLLAIALYRRLCSRPQRRRWRTERSCEPRHIARVPHGCDGRCAVVAEHTDASRWHRVVGSVRR
jgi:hypothetical protein